MEHYGPIQLLPSALLTKIFSYLPLKDRYLAYLVSEKWAEAARVPWTDITFLNLKCIPRAMADPILGLCPRLETIEAYDCTFVLEEKQNPPIYEHVRTLKLHNVKFVRKDSRTLIASNAGKPLDERQLFQQTVELTEAYFERFPNLADLIVRDCAVTYSANAKDDCSWIELDTSLLSVVLPDELASSLERLVLLVPPSHDGGYFNLMMLEDFQMLECAYLNNEDFVCLLDYALPALRELCLVNLSDECTSLGRDVAAGKFPNLKVLVYASDRSVDVETLTQLINAQLALRILVIVGKGSILSSEHETHDLFQYFGAGDLTHLAYPIVLPPRQFLPDSNTPNSTRTPPLQIFVGGDFTKHVRFTLPKSEVAQFWRIDCPMPDYLAKPEVAAVFKDVWVAKVIREGPKNGLAPWGSPDRMDLFYSTSELMFF